MRYNVQSHEYGELVIVADHHAIAQEGARRFAAVAQAAIAARGRFVVALSGGSTPRGLYEQLAQPPYDTTIDWAHVHIFWGDERYVPPDDPESTYGMTRAALLDQVPIPAANIYPAPTTNTTPEAAAQTYAHTLATVLGEHAQLDLILLGMGPDGHTASLFPGAPAVTTPSAALVVAVYDAPKPPPTRLTLTLHAINTAAHVLFLVAGADKAATLRDVLQENPAGALLPAQRVRPTHGTLVWLVDQAAAQALDVGRMRRA